MGVHTAVNITEEQKKSFNDEGFMILERVIPDEMLAMLRDECKDFIDKEHAAMDKAGTDKIGGNIRGKRYFIAQRYKQGKRLHEFIFSEEMAEICRATLGPDAFLMYEQWVVKGAEQGMKFSWHQDSGYAAYPHKRYLTCWCALDDMTVENGTAYILPFSRAGTRDVQPHVREGLDLVGYHGADPGDPVLVPAGSIAVFTSHTFHRSGFNTSSRMRRVYVVQYTSEPMGPPEGKSHELAEPFLKGGRIVR